MKYLIEHDYIKDIDLAITFNKEFEFLNKISFYKRGKSLNEEELNFCLDCYNYYLKQEVIPRVAKHVTLKNVLEKL